MLSSHIGVTVLAISQCFFFQSVNIRQYAAATGCQIPVHSVTAPFEFTLQLIISGRQLKTLIDLTIRNSFSIPVFRFQMDGIIAPVFGPTAFSITLIQDIGSEVPVNEYSPFIIRILIPSFKRTFVVLQIQVGNVFTDSVRDNCRFKGIN